MDTIDPVWIPTLAAVLVPTAVVLFMGFVIWMFPDHGKGDE